jgi:hypothetical protein
MTYRDKTFCSGDGCAKFNQCPRALTEQVKQSAKTAGLPISRWAEPRLLDCYGKPQTNNAASG